jgi:DNA-binding NtrC family response regulator
VNVSGLDDTIFSDTLFGHTRGAFTGADSARNGMIEQATNGTLFLDEIGDLSIPSQVKRKNAGVVVATHHDLAAKLPTGQFRKDFYYRLCAHHVHIPPLRERPDDIPLLFDFYLDQAARNLENKKPTVPKELYVLLANYPFPGNIRELKAMVYDAMSQHQAHMLSMDSFRKIINKKQVGTCIDSDNHQKERQVFVPHEPLPALHEVDELLIAEAMRRAEGNQSIASRLIGISQPALSKRLKKSCETH